MCEVNKSAMFKAKAAEARKKAQAIYDGATEESGLTDDQLKEIETLQASAKNFDRQAIAAAEVERVAAESAEPVEPPVGTVVKNHAVPRDAKSHAEEVEQGIGLCFKHLAMGGGNAAKSLEASDDNGAKGSGWAKKTLTAGATPASNASYGFVIPTSDVGVFIDLYRSKTVIRANAPPAIAADSGSYGTKMTTDPVAVWQSATENPSTLPNATNMAGARFVPSEKTLVVHMDATNRLLRDSGSLANFVRGKLAQAVALAEEAAAIAGTGASGQPTGLLSQIAAGNTFAAAAGAITVAKAETEFKRLFNALRAANAPQSKIMQFADPVVYSALERLRTAGDVSAYPEVLAAGRLGPYPLQWHNLVTAGVFAALDMDDVQIYDFGGVSVTVSREASYTNGAGTLVSAFMQGTTVFKLEKGFDIGLNHDTSSAKITTIQWT